MNRKQTQNREIELKPFATVGEMAAMVGLSRSRYNDLVKSGFFLFPLYSIDSRRPFYTAEMQTENLAARESRIGINGEFVMFYRQRKSTAKKPRKITHQKENHGLIAQRLKQLGVNATTAQIEEAIKACFPDGTKNKDEMSIVRALMRHLRQPQAMRFIED